VTPLRSVVSVLGRVLIDSLRFRACNHASPPGAPSIGRRKETADARKLLKLHKYIHGPRSSVYGCPHNRDSAEVASPLEAIRGTHSEHAARSGRIPPKRRTSRRWVEDSNLEPVS
jgi:hypothetical protein